MPYIPVYQFLKIIAKALTKDPATVLANIDDPNDSIIFHSKQLWQVSHRIRDTTKHHRQWRTKQQGVATGCAGSVCTQRGQSSEGDQEVG